MDKFYKNKRRHTGKVWVGFILLAIGTVMLFRALGFFVPDWIFSWPMFLIVIGLIIGFRHNFRRPGAYILILIGSVFLLERMVPALDLDHFLWPVAIIALGIYLIVGRSRLPRPLPPVDNQGWDRRVDAEHSQEEPVNFSSGEDYLDAVAVFGGVKKNIVSKKFRGGDIVTIMGGAEINFSQADLAGPVVLEVTQIFGGTKIILPSHWKVSSEMAAIFGGIEDKRVINQEVAEADKVLIIKGTSVFGGIEIRSF